MSTQLESAENSTPPDRDAPRAGLPKLPIFPYLRIPVPQWLYRFDTRAPEEIFEDGFMAWGTGLDLCRHVAGFSDYQRISGFISTASDVRTAIDMFISWKVKKDDLLKAWSMDVEMAQYAKKYGVITKQIRESESLAPIPSVRDALKLAALYAKELEVLFKVNDLADSRQSAAWVEGWVYTIKSTPYYISVEKNLQDPSRDRLAGARAVALSKEATEWAVPFYIQTQSIKEAVRVRFTRLKQQTGKPASLVHDVLLEARKNAKYDANVVYDPYGIEHSITRRRPYKGLIGYWAPVRSGDPGHPYAPGSSDFPDLPAAEWSGKQEYERPDGPRYPFGRPSEIKPAYPAWQAKGK
ncbi:hypothetical protein HET69_23520 [Streptomyces sp. CJ_13]|uniref:hypothetical protein n=1 Tax=Streptomyces TaxID=1883 RepID=UPI001BDDAE1D|nr:hypothetical protein [Streptomyces sp. CJ_13]MBT1186884.1 hypothetical protein [Streptomyces sp. CJ_13]